MIHCLNYGYTNNNRCGWENRYRPKSLEEVVLPARLKELFISYRDDQAASPLLLWGDPGTGKTTSAWLFNPDATTMIAASRLKDYDLDSPEFLAMCSTLPVTSEHRNRRRVIALDEADTLTEHTQKSLRSLMEQYASTTWFVFTANYKDRFIPALLSRVDEVGFGFYEEEMNDLMVGRCMEILEKEKRIMKKSDVEHLVRVYGPDMRQILIQLQKKSTFNQTSNN